MRQAPARMSQRQRVASRRCWQGPYVGAPCATRNFVRRDGTVVGKLTKQNLMVRLPDVKKAIKAGESIVGADLEFRNNLIRR